MRAQIALSFCFFLLLLFACKTNTVNTATTTATTGTIPEDINRFESTILKFEQEDKEKGIQKDIVLFTGSSSIVFWQDLVSDMEPMPVLNRGFGGSTIPEVNHYMERIIFPHQPSMLVFYCGENDIDMGASPETATQSFKTFHEKVNKQFPNIPIVFISMKPSLSRWDKWEAMQKGNQLIKDYIDTHSNLSYVDVGPVMLNQEGTPDESIFIKDGLHMNREGYIRWTKLMKTHILEVYQQKVGKN